MANYFLFLDELKANKDYEYFCMGGCFVEEQYYRKTLVRQVNKFKNDIFGNTSIILHEVDARSHSDSFRKLSNSDKEGKFWKGLGDIYKNHDIYTLCAGIHKNNLTRYYPTEDGQDYEYYIALQIVLENFVHFLISVDGKGCVYFESRDLISDYELSKHYNMIKNNGTLFLSPECMQERLKCISFPLKIDNNIGLQLADFVLNPVARDFQKKEQRELNIFEEIKAKSYNGNIDRNDRFGLKKIL